MLFRKKNTITLDAARFTDRKALYEALREAIPHDGAFGESLDALHDVLTSIGRQTELRIVHFDKAEQALGDYAERLALVLAASASQNRRLTVVFA